MMGCSQIRYLETSEDSFFYGTSDEGELFSARWAAKKPEDAARLELLVDYWDFYRNYRPTVNMQLSPFSQQLILTIHDCNFCLWRIDCKHPVFVSPTIENTFITCGFFSQHRPGVLFIGRADGRIDIWDFVDQSHLPTQQHFVVAIGISSMCTDDNDRNKIAIGDRDGCTHLLRLPDNLVYPIQNESKVIDKFFL